MKTRLIISLMFVFVMKAGSLFAQTKSKVLEDGGTGPYKAVVYEVDGFGEHTISPPKICRSSMPTIRSLFWYGETAAAPTHRADMRNS